MKSWLDELWLIERWTAWLAGHGAGVQLRVLVITALAGMPSQQIHTAALVGEAALQAEPLGAIRAVAGETLVGVVEVKAAEAVGRLAKPKVSASVSMLSMTA